jgi:hypothetical protein
MIDCKMHKPSQVALPEKLPVDERYFVVTQERKTINSILDYLKSREGRE